MWRRSCRREPAGLKSSCLFTDTRAKAFDQVWTLPCLLGLVDSVQNLLYRMLMHTHTLNFVKTLITLDVVSSSLQVQMEHGLFNHVQVHCYISSSTLLLTESHGEVMESCFTQVPLWYIALPSSGKTVIEF